MTKQETFSTTRDNIEIFQKYCFSYNLSKSEFYERAAIQYFSELTGVYLDPCERKPNRITKNKSKLKKDGRKI